MNEYRDSSNRLTYDFDDIEEKNYIKITKEIVKEFSLEPDTEKTSGLDEVFQDYKINNMNIGLEWDIWSGYIVCAKNIKSEPLATKIAIFIKHHHYS